MPTNVTQQAIYIRSGDPATENEPTLLYPGQLGMRITVKEPGPLGAPAAAVTYPGGGTGISTVGRDKTFQLIRTDSSATIAPYKGALAWWSDKLRYLVTTTQVTKGRNQVAGVFQGSITLGNFGFMQVGGPATVKVLDAPTASPSPTSSCPVIPSSTDPKADCLATSTAPTQTLIGYTEDSVNPADQTVTVNLIIPTTP